MRRGDLCQFLCWQRGYEIPSSAAEQCLKPVDVDDREGRTFPVIE
jgi:hypothetical protein